LKLRHAIEWYKDILTVLSVAYPLFPVGPDSAGGAEQILYLLDREIVRSGRRSLVVAQPDSTVSGELVASIEEALHDYSIDLIHFHGLDFNDHVPETNVRMLATMHLPLAWYPQQALLRADVQKICVSRSQAADTGFRIVLNGIDTARFHSAPKRDYLLWMGRICPEKGVHIALEVARERDLPLYVAGPVHPFPSHGEYFREKVEPLFDSKRRYLGPVSGEAKNRLLAEARCLLIPSLVAETSSLVAMEAISSGTPVIAYANGALPEVIDHGKTGFIVHSQEEMSAALDRIPAISPDLCRQTAEARFDASRMARDYFTLYG
jgi:glycosyltransferase involved in cell wall biosynthesis